MSFFGGSSVGGLAVIMLLSGGLCDRGFSSGPCGRGPCGRGPCGGVLCSVIK